ncbi:MAG: hypothetical protein HeimC2_09540 [Candidatus Heimdallarchaeota archaeon LC_2]|nr:MAG: hypothetical protein HeimC2_09540 [Candidatus Heimdallarchaeota archaeon LC_2]
MKNTLILPIGLILTGIIITGVVLTYDISLESTNDNQTNLTAEDVIVLAIHDLGVSEFVRQTQAYAEAEHDNGIWTVRFTEITNINRFIEVKIDDNTELILDSKQSDETSNLAAEQQFNNEADFYSPQNDVASQEDSMVISEGRGGLIEDYYYYNNPELIEAAIDYFVNLEIVTNFLNNNDIEFYGYSYDESIVYLWGNNYENYDIWMNVILNVKNIDEDNWTFEVQEISSSSLFGKPKNTFTEMHDLVKITNEFIEFVDKVVNYTSYEVLFYYGDQSQDEYIFKMRYSPLYYFFDYPIEIGDEIGSGSDGSDLLGLNQDDDLVSEPYYLFYDEWIEFEVSDLDATIKNIWGPNSALLSANEAMALVLQNAEIQSWLNEITIFNNYTYYDGYGNWWISLYDLDDYYNYAYARLNDRTETLDEIFTILSVSATMNESQLHEIISNLQTTKLFFDEVDNYEYYFYYDHYGVWYFSYYDPDNYYNYLWGSINDNDGSIVNIQVKIYKEPRLSEHKVIEFLGDSGVDDFKNLYPDVVISVYYNGYDTWYIYGYSMILVEAWFWAQIDDNSGDLIEYTENHPINLPELTVDEIISIAHTTDEYKEIKDLTDISYEYYYYYDGNWYYYMQGTDDETFYWLSITINDNTGEIEEIWFSSWLYNTHAYQEPDYNEKDETVIIEATG